MLRRLLSRLRYAIDVATAARWRGEGREYTPRHRREIHPSPSTQNREREQQEADTAALARRKHKKEARAEKRAARRAARDEKKAQEYEASKKAFARQRSESLEGASPKSKAKAAKTDDSYLGGFFRSLSSLVGVEA